MYTIHPIKCGTLTAPKSSLTYRLDRDVWFTFPVFAFLLLPIDLAEGSVILVDTGVKASESDYMVGRGRTVGPPGGGPAPLKAGLAAHGLEPSDVDTVVLTHLHHDHAANVDLFETAEFVVQRPELVAARNPLPILANAYIEGTVEHIQNRCRVVDGDELLRDGLSLLFTPGHTEGSQTVVVETPDGSQALVGDLAYIRHNLDPSMSSIEDAMGTVHEITPLDAAYVPPGTHVDVQACYESVKRVAERLSPDGAVRMCHDSAIVPLPTNREEDIED